MGLNKDNGVEMKVRTIEMRKKPELLAPAGNMEKCKMAFLYGADAVYLGGNKFGLRAYAANFDIEEIRKAVEFAHDLGKKVYVTVNIFAQNDDIAELPEYIENVVHFKREPEYRKSLPSYKKDDAIIFETPQERHWWQRQNQNSYPLSFPA